MGHKGTVRIGGQYMDRLEEFQMPDTPKPTLAQAPPPNDYGGYTGSAANHHHVYDNVLGVLLDGHAVATPVEEGSRWWRPSKRCTPKGALRSEGRAWSKRTTFAGNTA